MKRKRGTNGMILIVDDDPSITASLALLLKQSGYPSRSVSSPAEAAERIEKEKYRLVLQDMNFSRQTSGEEGLELLRHIKTHKPLLPVILMTAWGSIELAVKGMRAGASDFITKPWTHEQLLQSVQTVLGLAEAASRRDETALLKREDLDASCDFRGLIGEDPKLLKILDLISRIAATEASILITGESGTGKELVAEVIHWNSNRKEGPFIKVNLGGISSSLFESEMFGHVKGAFTDAIRERKGRFDIAHRGTIFLDEIGDLDPGSQVKLLRVLQDRTYEALGSSDERTVDVRVISATNRNLTEMVERESFREDLLYRLNLITIHLPPLRERVGDIPLLAGHFLQGISKIYRKTSLTISQAALDWLKGMTWPGNIRQLKQVIERAVLVSGKTVLEVEDFVPILETEPGEGKKRALPEIGSMTLDEIEEEMIRKSLERYGGQISKAAKALGLSRAALYRRMEKYGIKP